MKWLGASGAIVAGLILAGVGTRFELDGGAATMDRVPWGLVLLVVLIGESGLGRHQPLPRAEQHCDFCVSHLGDFWLSPRADVADAGVW